MKHSKSILALILIFCVLLTACSEDSSPAEESKVVEEAVPVVETDIIEEDEAVEEKNDYKGFIEENIAQGNYHDALSALILWADEGVYEEDGDSFEALHAEIISNAGKNEPESGTELERTFKYQGGGLLIVNAESGPVEVTAVDTEDDSQYVRFYVREGETAEINIPASVYKITYKLGIVWFDSESGFGDVCYNGSYEESFDFSSESDNAWITNTQWELTI